MAYIRLVSRDDQTYRVLAVETFSIQSGMAARTALAKKNDLVGNRLARAEGFHAIYLPDLSGPPLRPALHQPAYQWLSGVR